MGKRKKFFLPEALLGLVKVEQTSSQDPKERLRKKKSSCIKLKKKWAKLGGKSRKKRLSRRC